MTYHALTFRHYAPPPDLPDAKCKGVEYPEVFFPRKYDVDDFRYAVAKSKALCEGCPERTPCLDWALENNVHGIWAGTDEAERRDMTRKRKASA